MRYKIKGKRTPPIQYSAELEVILALNHFGLMSLYGKIPGSRHWATAETGFLTLNKIVAAYRLSKKLEAIETSIRWGD